MERINDKLGYFKSIRIFFIISHHFDTACSQSPPPGTETRENEATIRYNIVKGAVPDIFNVFAPNIGGNNGLLNHGCWCSKMNPLSGAESQSGIRLGGCEPVDEIDRLCKLCPVGKQFFFGKNIYRSILKYIDFV